MLHPEDAGGLEEHTSAHRRERHVAVGARRARVIAGPHLLAELRELTRLKLDLLERFDEYISFQPFSEEAYDDRGRPLMMNVHADGDASRVEWTFQT